MVLGYDRVENQVALAVVDKAVLMTLRAVGAASRRKLLVSAVAQHFALSLENEHYLAVALVGVQSDGSSVLQPAAHYLDFGVGEHSREERTLSALEMLQRLFFDVGKIYQHIIPPSCCGLCFPEYVPDVIRQREAPAVDVLIVILGFQPLSQPPFRVLVRDRVEPLARESEQPVPGGVGRDMRLINQRYREEALNAAVGALHYLGVLVVERAFMLVHKYAVLIERLVAVAVEFLCKQPLAGSERVGGIHDYQVVFVIFTADVFQTVLVEDMHAGIVKPARGLWEILLADLNDALIYLHHVDVLDVFEAGQLADSSAVARAYYKNAFYIGIRRHRNVGYHLVIDVLVLFRQHDESVKHQYPAKLVAVENIYLLIAALLAVDVLFYLYGEPYVVRMVLCKP